jgi:hypothetical protein
VLPSEVRTAPNPAATTAMPGSSPAMASTANADGPSVADVAAHARRKALESQARAPANGLVVPAPLQQRALAMLDVSQVRAYLPMINWDLPPAFPGEAAPEQPIKLPRHSKVMQVRQRHEHEVISWETVQTFCFWMMECSCCHLSALV